MGEDEGSAPTFLFVACQVGVESLCKQRMQEHHPDLRFAFSRPGFLTFKVTGGEPSAGFDLKNEFVRTWGRSLGRVEKDSTESLAEQFWNGCPNPRPDHLHVWARDTRPVGAGFEPGPSELSEQVAAALRKAAPKDARRIRINDLAPVGARVLDCIVVEPDQWWLGAHDVASPPSSWPGGVPPLTAPENMLSRAYLKMHEALAWSRLPIREGDVCVELGSAPGGAAQSLLEHGLVVLGIDPAEVDPIVGEHPAFRHIRKRGREVKRRELSAARWLVSDANVTPAETLDTIEGIVEHDAVNIRGMLITLKLKDWRLADEVSGYLERVRGWGFRYVRPRHLAFNRRELCVAALRNRNQRRF